MCIAVYPVCTAIWKRTRRAMGMLACLPSGPSWALVLRRGFPGDTAGFRVRSGAESCGVMGISDLEHLKTPLSLSIQVWSEFTDSIVVVWGDLCPPPPFPSPSSQLSSETVHLTHPRQEPYVIWGPVRVAILMCPRHLHLSPVTPLQRRQGRDYYPLC